MHWLKEQAEDMQYYEQDGCSEIKIDSDQIRGRNWSRTCLVQFRCFSEQLVAEARRESEDRYPMLGGETKQSSQMMLARRSL